MINPDDPPEDVKKWIRKLKLLMNKCPKGLWFFSNGELHIMASGKNGRPVMDGESYDSDYIIDYISGNIFDGGDW